MAILTRVVRELEKRKAAALTEVERIEEALTALRGVSSGRARQGQSRSRPSSEETYVSRSSPEDRRRAAPEMAKSAGGEYTAGRFQKNYARDQVVGKGDGC